MTFKLAADLQREIDADPFLHAGGARLKATGQLVQIHAWIDEPGQPRKYCAVIPGAPRVGLPDKRLDVEAHELELA